LHGKITNPSYITSLLNRYGTEAKKGFGQNFLISEHVLAQMVKAGDIQESDTIVEVGPRSWRPHPRALSPRTTRHLDRKRSNDAPDSPGDDPSRNRRSKRKNNPPRTGCPSLRPIETSPHARRQLQAHRQSPLQRRDPDPRKSPHQDGIRTGPTEKDRRPRPKRGRRKGRRTNRRSLGPLTHLPAIWRDQDHRDRSARIVPPCAEGHLRHPPDHPARHTAHPEAQLPLYRKLVHTAFSQKRKMLNKSLQQLLPKEIVLELLKKAEISPEIRPQNLPLEKWLTLASIAINMKSC
jgi:hypothetical protein